MEKVSSYARTSSARLPCHVELRYADLQSATETRRIFEISRETSKVKATMLSTALSYQLTTFFFDPFMNAGESLLPAFLVLRDYGDTVRDIKYSVI